MCFVPMDGYQYGELDRDVSVCCLLFARSGKVIPAAGCCRSVAEKGCSRPHQIFVSKLDGPECRDCSTGPQHQRSLSVQRSKIKEPKEIEIPVENWKSFSTQMCYSTLRPESVMQTTLASGSAWSLLRSLTNFSRKSHSPSRGIWRLLSVSHPVIHESTPLRESSLVALNF